MSKVIIITDSHIGVRNNSVPFLQYQMERWKELFAYADEHDVLDIIHGGDFFDNRSSISMSVLAATRRFNEMLVNWGGRFRLLVGNHDVAYKNDNTLNSPDLLLEGVDVYWSRPVTVVIGGAKIDLIPWINNANYEEAMSFIRASNSPICVGHFEVNGAPFQKNGVPCEHGIDASLFSCYHRVLSGHFHTRSRVGKVEYIGAAFDYTWADWNDERGFVVLDTETMELEYVNWSTFMFVMGLIDEDGNIEYTPECESITGKYVRIVSEHESNKKIEAALRDVESKEPAELQVFFSSVNDVNDKSIDLDELTDETKVMQQVVEEAISDEALRHQVNVYLEQLYREAASV